MKEEAEVQVEEKTSVLRSILLAILSVIIVLILSFIIAQTKDNEEVDRLVVLAQLLLAGALGLSGLFLLFMNFTGSGPFSLRFLRPVLSRSSASVFLSGLKKQGMKIKNLAAVSNINKSKSITFDESISLEQSAVIVAGLFGEDAAIDMYEIKGQKVYIDDNKIDTPNNIHILANVLHNSKKQFAAFSKSIDEFYKNFGDKQTYKGITARPIVEVIEERKLLFPILNKLKYIHENAIQNCRYAIAMTHDDGRLFGFVEIQLSMDGLVIANNHVILRTSLDPQTEEMIAKRLRVSNEQAQLPTLAVKNGVVNFRTEKQDEYVATIENPQLCLQLRPSTLGETRYGWFIVLPFIICCLIAAYGLFSVYNEDEKLLYSLVFIAPALYAVLRGGFLSGFRLPIYAVLISIVCGIPFCFFISKWLAEQAILGTEKAFYIIIAACAILDVPFLNLFTGILCFCKHAINFNDEDGIEHVACLLASTAAYVVLIALLIIVKRTK